MAAIITSVGRWSYAIFGSSKSDGYTLNDFRRQLNMFSNPHILEQLSFIPGLLPILDLRHDPVVVREFLRLAGIIDAMTPGERVTPKVIDCGRRNRIANGAGVRPNEVEALVKQFEVMKRLIDEDRLRGPVNSNVGLPPKGWG